MIIHLISSPRTVSTSLMYAFDNREDTVALDEPFYAYYLAKTKKQHPGLSEIMAEQSSNAADVFELIDQTANSSPHVFVKNMGHHTIDIESSSYGDFVNIFFIRDPRRVVASFAKVIAQPTLFDLGIKHQWELYNELLKNESKALIIDSTELLKNPETTLRNLCDKIGLVFHHSMLSWKAGARSIDGSWAKYWYKRTHLSTGFETFIEQEIVLSAENQGVYLEALPYYNKLFQQSIHK